MTSKRKSARYTYADALWVLVAKHRDGLQMTKQGLSEELGCCIKTVDRCVAELKAAGRITVKPVLTEAGGNVGNLYMAVWPDEGKDSKK